jgi:hypothetical protein
VRIALKNVRGAFLNLFEAKAFEDGPKSYSGTFILGPKHPQFKELNDAITAVAKEKWGAKADAVLKSLKATDKVCLHDGDTKSNYEGFEGNFFVNARNKVRPTAMNRDKTPVSEEDGVIYSGCYVVAYLELWAMDNKFGKRVCATLRGVQYFGPGDAFSGGGAPLSEDEAEDLSVEGEDPTA